MFTSVPIAILSFLPVIAMAAQGNECDLPCQNGYCRLGEDNPYNTIGDMLGDPYDKFGCSTCKLPYLENRQVYKNDGKRCECFPGYTGYLCEVPMKFCGEPPEHVCFNNGNCVPIHAGYGGQDRVPSKYLCDCTATHEFGQNSYTGHMCEQVSKVFCSSGDREDSKDLFCVHGECKDVVAPGKSHPGCRCNDGYEGPKCEFVTGMWWQDKIVDTSEQDEANEQPAKPASSPTPPLAVQSQESDSGGSSGVNKNDLILGFGLGGLIVLIIIIMFTISPKKKSERAKHPVGAPSNIDPDGSGTLPKINYDSETESGAANGSLKADEGEMA